MGIGLAVCLAVVLLLGLHLHNTKLRLETAQRQLSVVRSESSQRTPAFQSLDQRAKLQQFSDYLLTYDDIPDVIQALFRLAEAEGLTLQRGEYKPEIDQRGNFLRFRMSLPIKGDPQAIYRFILTALHQNKSLALESVQFKRERADAKDVEVNIQWLLLTKLPPSARDSNVAISGQDNKQ
jgi:hypothetical protein